MLTVEELRRVLAYDPESGVFKWRVTLSRRAVSGKRAGSKNTIGYIEIGIANVSYLAHRLAWLYVTGEWPQNEIDHRDGSRANNSFANLRDIPHAGQQQNYRRARRDSILGYLGVSRNGKRFSATIQLSGKRTYLGTFDTPRAAHAAYVAEKRRIHEFGTL